VLPPALVSGGVKLQVPPFRCAPVGMTNWRVALPVGICQWSSEVCFRRRWLRVKWNCRSPLPLRSSPTARRGRRDDKVRAACPVEIC
jgi:hypothetical protein